MTTKLMWTAMDLQFILIRCYPFPFPFYFNKHKLTLHYNSSLSIRYVHWHLLMKLGLPTVFVVSCGFLCREVFKPSEPPLSLLQIFALIGQAMLGVLCFDFATEFSTHGRGVINIFNELKRIERS